MKTSPTALQTIHAGITLRFVIFDSKKFYKYFLGSWYYHLSRFETESTKRPHLSDGSAGPRHLPKWCHPGKLFGSGSTPTRPRSERVSRPESRRWRPLAANSRVKLSTSLPTLMPSSSKAPPTPHPTHHPYTVDGELRPLWKPALWSFILQIWTWPKPRGDNLDFEIQFKMMLQFYSSLFSLKLTEYSFTFYKLTKISNYFRLCFESIFCVLKVRSWSRGDQLRELLEACVGSQRR